MRLYKIAKEAAEVLGWGLIVGALVVSVLFVCDAYGQGTLSDTAEVLESEARIYEEDGRLEIEHVQGMYEVECADLFFGVRVQVEVEEGEWPYQWWIFNQYPGIRGYDPEWEDTEGGGCLWTLPEIDSFEGASGRAFPVLEVLKVHIVHQPPGYTHQRVAELEPVFVPIPPPPPPKRSSVSGGNTGGGGDDGNNGGGSYTPPTPKNPPKPTCASSYSMLSEVPKKCQVGYFLHTGSGWAPGSLSGPASDYRWGWNWINGRLCQSFPEGDPYTAAWSNPYEDYVSYWPSSGSCP